MSAARPGLGLGALSPAPPSWVHRNSLSSSIPIRPISISKTSRVEASGSSTTRTIGLAWGTTPASTDRRSIDCGVDGVGGGRKKAHPDEAADAAPRDRADAAEAGRF